MDGKRLKKLRLDRKLTQTQLGKIINVTKVSISGYENGERTPDTDNLARLADYFGVSADYLLGRTDDPNEKFYVKEMEFEGFFGFDLDSLSDGEITELKENIKKEISFYLWQKEKEDE